MLDASTESGDRHLGHWDLDVLLSASKQDDPRRRALAHHLAACPECRKRLDAWRHDHEHAENGTDDRDAPESACPALEDWLELDRTPRDENIADRLLGHAASCARCGAVLKAVMEGLNSDDLPASAAPALTDDFRRRLLRKLAPKSVRRPAWRIAVAAAAMLLVVAAWQWFRRPDPQRLLAQAYSARRTMEVRFPGAEYAPLRVTKGSENGAPQEASFVEAELLILRALGKEPDSPKWLHLRSRLDLLRWQYDRSIATLEPLASTQSPDPSISLDLGAAYLLRGIHQRTASDFHKSVETLSRVMKASTERSEVFRVALFNRAVALEQLFLWDSAAADWKRYLALDPNSGWAKEAQNRLQQIEARKNAWRDSLRDHQLEPAPFLALSATNPGIPVEHYLDRVVKDWLVALVQAPGPAGAETEAAVRTVAALTMRNHRDAWLTDLLAYLDEPSFHASVLRLAEAVRANAEGERDRAAGLARQAEDLFASSGNIAGMLRARVEQVYALSRSFHSVECEAASREIAPKLLARRYRWAYGQLQLERSTCAVRAGNLGEAHVFLEDAIRHVRDSGYSTLLLRGLGFAANLQQVLGRYDHASQRDWEGLALFWSGLHPPLRGYQFYANMSQVAERQKQWEVGYLASREALPVIELGGIPSTEAMARYRVAMFAGVTGRVSEALAEIARGDATLDSLRREGAVPTLRAENHLLLASSYLETGLTELSSKVLDQVVAADLQDSLLFRVAYHRILGTARLRHGDLAEARRNLDTAMNLANAACARLRTESDRAYWRREAGSVYRQLVRLALDHDRDPELALAIWEQFRGLPVHGFGASQSRSQATKTIRTLASRYRNASVLSYAELDDALVGWFYDDRGIHTFRTRLSASKTGAMCAAFAQLAARRSTPIKQVRAHSKELYDVLIAPVEEHLDPARLLLVEPDGPCAGVPFEILVDRSERYLIDRLALATSPGAFAESALRSLNRPVTASMHAVLVENPRLGTDLISLYPPLPHSAREAELVASMFPAHSRLTGAAATLDAVMAELPRAGVFYFGGHGASYSDRGGFLLSPPSDAGAALLDGALLESAIRDCRLVILSACSTAAGERMGSFNPASLIQALWRAGVPNVVATRWEVDEAATGAVVGSMLKAVLSGVPAPLALRAAVTAFRHDSKSEHPATWAAFHVFGTSPATKEESNGYKPTASGRILSPHIERPLSRSLGVRD